jgi:DNA-binding NarL/FixJ family response regulator
VDSIDVIIVEDHPLFREGLRRMLKDQPDLNVLTEVGDGGEVLDAVRQHNPDLVLMDVNLPTQNGLLTARQVKGEFPDVKIIILTAYHDEEQNFHAIRSGASAYFAKDVAPDQLLTAIHEVAQGNYILDGTVMNESRMENWLLKQFESLARGGEINEDAFTPLSAREMEILVLITRGYSNKEVAHSLGISRQTVKNHMTAILRKLDVSDRTQAAVYALRHGWIRLQDTRYDR